MMNGALQGHSASRKRRRCNGRGPDGFRHLETEIHA